MKPWFRFALAEIELVLHQEPIVKEAIVVAQKDTSGSKRLVAYIVPRVGQKPKIDEIRHKLSKKLPDYMLPTLYIWLDKLPLTPHGKIDRKRLPRQDFKRPELDGEYLAPRTPVEHELAKIWSELLDIEHIGIRDNFFDLGGHSLMAAQVIALIRKILKIEISLRSVFEAPTIEALALIINLKRATESSNQELEDILTKLDS